MFVPIPDFSPADLIMPVLAHHNFTYNATMLVPASHFWTNNLTMSVPASSF
jgi:hypothetical protein